MNSQSEVRTMRAVLQAQHPIEADELAGYLEDLLQSSGEERTALRQFLLQALSPAAIQPELAAEALRAVADELGKR